MYSLEEAIIANMSREMSNSIDKMIIDELWDTPKTYRIEKSWRDRRGGQMYRIAVSGRVLEWLETTQSQYGISNPSWWKFQDQINISDKMLSLLILKWGKD
jgi:hypothetical protein